VARAAQCADSNLKKRYKNKKKLQKEIKRKKK